MEEKLMQEALKAEKENFTGSLDVTFGLPSRDWKQYAPLTLAYIGDAAYELTIRSIFVKQADMQTQKLNQRVIRCVSARAQSRLIRFLLPELTQEEQAIYRRGRNAKPATKAKNASITEYLEATGFEAVIGFLYLEGRFERMHSLIQKGLEVLL